MVVVYAWTLNLITVSRARPAKVAFESECACRVRERCSSFRTDEIEFIGFIEISCSLLDEPLSADRQTIVGLFRGLSASNYTSLRSNLI